MKLISRIFLITNICISLNLNARDIIVIESKLNSPQIEVIINVLTKKFNFPKKYIKLRSNNGQCLKNLIQDESLIHFCIDSAGEIIILKLSKYGMENTLNEFINLQNEARNEI